MTSVVVCRGASCRLDDGAVSRLGDGADRVWTTDCLGLCEQANVVVVRGAAGRRWFGGMGAADVEALAAWMGVPAGAALPPRLVAREFVPVEAPAVGRRLDLGAGVLAELVHHLLATGCGGWTVGVLGAAAELPATTAAVVTRRAATVESTGAEGGLRLTVGDDIAAFAFEAPATGAVVALVLGVPRSTLGVAAEGMVDHGPDVEALRPEDRTARLVDLGLGAPTASFCVRTADRGLHDVLRRHATSTWRDLIDEAGPKLIEASPHRVVRTPIGRAEVYAPIPAPGAASPIGPHTHLLAGELELGRELPAFMALPAGWAAAAIHHPPPGWTLSVG